MLREGLGTAACRKTYEMIVLTVLLFQLSTLSPLRWNIKREAEPTVNLSVLFSHYNIKVFQLHSFTQRLLFRSVAALPVPTAKSFPRQGYSLETVSGENHLHNQTWRCILLPGQNCSHPDGATFSRSVRKTDATSVLEIRQKYTENLITCDST